MIIIFSEQMWYFFRQKRQIVMPGGQFSNGYRDIIFFVPQSRLSFNFQRIPRVEKTARQQFHEMHYGDRLIKVEDLSVGLRDKSKRDHFKYNKYI